MAIVIGVVSAAAMVPLTGQQPTFHSGVDLVTVDATVLGRDGRPIDSLGPDDFRLDVDGRPRHVVSAQFVSQAARGSRSSGQLPSHFTSNEHAETGRVVVVAVDEAHIRRLEGRPGALEISEGSRSRLADAVLRECGRSCFD